MSCRSFQKGETMRMLTRSLAALVSLLSLGLALAWLGLRVKARPFPTVAPGAVPAALPLPAGLPGPVARFARALYGDRLPAAQTAQVVGRAWLAPVGGVPLPARFRFSYDAASASYDHDIEVTWFTLPVLRIRERNQAGHAWLDLGPLGQVNDAPRTNRAAIQGYWAEALAWFPAIALSDARLRWEAVDDTSARVHLPGLDAAEALTLRFDAATGLLSAIDTRRYQNEAQPERWRWHNRVLAWDTVSGQRVPVRSETQWNEDAPWATWTVEQVVLGA
jgi:hypothetical protein